MHLILAEEMGVRDFTIFPDSAHFMEHVQQLSPKPNVVLLDIHVKPYTGFEMLAMLRQHPAFQDTPVIALTASVMNEEVQQLRTAGFNGVIAKPIDLESFPLMLSRVLSGEAIWSVVN
jgi:CheY-like chemotaxis protein